MDGLIFRSQLHGVGIKNRTFFGPPGSLCPVFGAHVESWTDAAAPRDVTQGAVSADAMASLAFSPAKYARASAVTRGRSIMYKMIVMLTHISTTRKALNPLTYKIFHYL